MSSDFEASLAKYQDFLKRAGYSPNTVWITPEDILVTNRPLLYVKMPVPAKNGELARRSFELGISQQRGVLFEAICSSTDMTFINAWVPRDESEAEQYQLPRGLKMSAFAETSRLRAQVIRSRLVWCLFMLKYRNLQKLKVQVFPGLEC